MRLKVLLPFEVFAEIDDVASIVAETADGAFGLLPRRRDCTAALPPGILCYTPAGAAPDQARYIAIDHGVLVKTGAEVRVAVRHAIAGADLGELRAAVERQFRTLDAEQRDVRAAMARLEAGFLRKMGRLHG